MKTWEIVEKQKRNMIERFRLHGVRHGWGHERPEPKEITEDTDCREWFKEPSKLSIVDGIDDDEEVWEHVIVKYDGQTMGYAKVWVEAVSTRHGFENEWREYIILDHTIYYLHDLSVRMILPSSLKID